MIYGATVLIVSILLKLLPESVVAKVPIMLDENKEIDPNDPVMAAYNKQAQAKALNVMKVEDGEGEKEKFTLNKVEDGERMD